MCVTDIPRGKVSILPNWVVLKDLLVFDNSKNPLAKPPGSKNPLEVFKRCFHRPRKLLMSPVTILRGTRAFFQIIFWYFKKNFSTNSENS